MWFVMIIENWQAVFTRSSNGCFTVTFYWCKKCVYISGDDTKLYEQLDMLYKIVHIVNFNTSLQALMLLYQVSDLG